MRSHFSKLNVIGWAGQPVTRVLPVAGTAFLCGIWYTGKGAGSTETDFPPQRGKSFGVAVICRPDLGKTNSKISFRKARHF